MRATRENLVIVTGNARDCRALVAQEAIHPGVIINPCASRDQLKAYLLSVIDFVTDQGNPDDEMVNYVLEVEEDGQGRVRERFSLAGAVKRLAVRACSNRKTFKP